MTGLPQLGIADFPAAFAAIHGVEPYAWQRRLLGKIAAEGAWPAAIAAPTGAGKTAVLDAALFHLALEAEVRPRRAPLRIVLAVDRRVIVDQAYDRARRIRDALAGAAGGGDALGRMAARLRSFSEAEPLHVAELRGGMPLERQWATRPDQPTILCTTVDQLGSRLLFRGYGVSPGMAPIHAGLLGMDALLILDEAHLSQAFADTLEAIALRRRAAETPDLPWGWTTLTATPRPKDHVVFALSAEEREEEAILRRLEARKPVELVETKAEEQDALAEAFAAEARRLLARLREGGAVAPGAPVVAVVVNRVGLARAVFERLAPKMQGEAEGAEAAPAEREWDAILLTGRVRPAERDQLVERWRRRLEGGSGAGDRPLLVVATQCVEAGADFDMDGMVSQIAPLDALRQRFGRLARTGNHSGARGGAPAPGVVLAPRADIARNADDPIYADRMAKTWVWLTARPAKPDGKPPPAIDFGPNALDALIQARAAETEPKAADCVMPHREAPLLRQADVELFAMTSPRPFPDPEPSLFLHGEFRPQTEVSLVWRADLAPLFAEARDRETDDRRRKELAERMAEIVAPLPPRAAEALSLPVWRVKAWLAARAADLDVADVEGRAPAENEGDGESGGTWALRWRGAAAERPELVRAKDILPGDVIVLPATAGGCDAYGWAPASKEPVKDIAALAARPYERARAALRLHPAVWGGEGEGRASWEEVQAALGRGLGARDLVREIRGLEGWRDAPALQLLRPYDLEADDPETPEAAVLFAPKGLPKAAADEAAADPATEGDLGSFGSAAVRLDAHAEAVLCFARRHAAALGLDERLTCALEVAARWHDAGKADPRFQAFLREVGRLPEAGGPYAKSGRSATPAEEKRARGQAQPPARWRHEAASVRFAARRLDEGGEDGFDADLALWLIGAHHGHGRPFFAHEDDQDGFDQELLGRPLPAAPGPDKLDFDWRGRDWAGLMAELQGRYGVWGLAFLEACLRLADHRASAAERGGG